jgi:hypothetical protein
VFLVICMSFSFSAGAAGSRRGPFFGRELLERGAMPVYGFLSGGLPPSAATRRQSNGA